MKYFKKIEGEKIYLSPINIDDIELYTKWLNNYKITNSIGMSSTLLGVEKEKNIIEDMIKSGYNFSIISKEKDKLLGNISLFDINQIHRNAMCGIFIGEEENHNKGYGKEALKLLLTYGFNTLNLNNVMLKVYAFNKRAIACYAKTGFKLIGIRRKVYFLNGEYHDELFMDILAEEFKNIYN